MSRIAIIIPYFGKWPEWFKLYLYSCSHNRNLDFIFFTDCKIFDLVYPPNVLFYQISFKDYCNLASSSLGIDFKPEDTYKLCDLRPFFGYIHKEILKDYDFWGYGDIDLIYGNLSLFLTSFRLKYFDAFSTHADRISGHFALFRNNKSYQELCFQIVDWEKLLKGPHIGMDETEFTRVVFPVNRYKSWIFKKIFRTNSFRDYWHKSYYFHKIFNIFLCNVFTKLCFKEYQTTHTAIDKTILNSKWSYNSWIYENGHIYSEDYEMEFIYLHFLFLKKNKFLKQDKLWVPPIYNISQITDKTSIIINHDGIFYKEAVRNIE